MLILFFSLFTLSNSALAGGGDDAIYNFVAYKCALKSDPVPVVRVMETINMSSVYAGQSGNPHLWGTDPNMDCRKNIKCESSDFYDSSSSNSGNTMSFTITRRDGGAVLVITLDKNRMNNVKTLDATFNGAPAICTGDGFIGL